MQNRSSGEHRSHTTSDAPSKSNSPHMDINDCMRTGHMSGITDLDTGPRSFNQRLEGAPA